MVVSWARVADRLPPKRDVSNRFSSASDEANAKSKLTESSSFRDKKLSDCIKSGFIFCDGQFGESQTGRFFWNGEI
jgi:hypothetical protein